MLRPFHLALPVTDLAQARAFYGGLLGCQEARSGPSWVDFDFYGNQLSLHLAKGPLPTLAESAVDGKSVPVPHFGVVLSWGPWQRVGKALRDAGVEFVIEPYTRFSGSTGEQGTMFFRDPSGNMLEIKGFRDDSQIFAPAIKT